LASCEPAVRFVDIGHDPPEPTGLSDADGTLEIRTVPATEEENLIDDFRGPAYFLSNFYRHPVRIGDDVYLTAEHAYQALKSDDPRERAWVLESETPLIAKRRGRKVRVVSYWADIRILVMEQVLEATSAIVNLLTNSSLLTRTSLSKATRGMTSSGAECHCGRCPGDGENMLGVALMELRDTLR
jgi:predicted NAD-dependent protein-ADP-ribosyltransferase YbiA (DUF1768 family)